MSNDRYLPATYGGAALDKELQRQSRYTEAKLAALAAADPIGTQALISTGKLTAQALDLSARLVLLGEGLRTQPKTEWGRERMNHITDAAVTMGFRELFETAGGINEQIRAVAEDSLHPAPDTRSGWQKFWDGDW